MPGRAGHLPRPARDLAGPAAYDQAAAKLAAMFAANFAAYAEGVPEVAARPARPAA